MKALFVSQGRALADSAMGHVRARQALDVATLPDTVAIRHLEIPAFTRGQRRALRVMRPLGRWNLWTLRFLVLRGLVARRAIRQALDAEPTDVVHVTTDQIALMLGSLRRRVPFVLSLDTLVLDWSRMTHGVAPWQRTPAYLKPIETMERRALEAASLCVAWTETVAQRIKTVAPAARVIALHPGIDLQTFSPAIGGGEEGKHARVLFVGGRWRSKGGPDLLEALRPRLGLDVVLDVVTQEQLPSGPGLALHEASPGSPKIIELFSGATALCLPTSADAAPWVVLEAMAMGVPVVATPVGSIPEMLGADTSDPAGIIVPVGDPMALRTALDQLVDTPGMRDAMSAAGRKRAASRYDAARNGAQLIRALRAVVDAGCDGG